MKKSIALLLGITTLLLGGCGAAAGVAAAGGAGSAAEAAAPSQADRAAETIAAPQAESALSPAKTAAPAPSAAPAGNSGSAAVTVSGKSEIKVTPDMAEITFGVETPGKDAAEAEKQNTREVDRVLSQLRELKVEDESIRTSDFSLYPRYDDFGNDVTGYTARTMLTVSNLSVDQVGLVISSCTEAGINQMNDIRYYSSSYDETYDAALREAVSEAEKKGRTLAEASGKELGAVVTIEEGYQDLSLRYSYDNGAAKYAATEEAMDLAGSMRVMPGELTVSAEVTITYELQG